MRKKVLRHIPPEPGQFRIRGRKPLQASEDVGRPLLQNEPPPPSAPLRPPLYRHQRQHNVPREVPGSAFVGAIFALAMLTVTILSIRGCAG